MKKSQQTGIILALIGGFIIYWAQSHSPTAGLGNVVGNAISGSYTMSENWYYISLVCGIAVAAFGVYKFITGK